MRILLILGYIILFPFSALAGVIGFKNRDALMLVLAVLGFYAAWKLVALSRRMRDQQQAQAAETGERRLRELKALAASRTFELGIRGGRNLPMILFGVLVMGAMAAFSVQLLLEGKRDVALIIGVVVVLPLALLFALAFFQSVARLGRPVLVLRHDGFSCDNAGTLRWQDVDGLFLRALEGRSTIVHYYLWIRVVKTPTTLAQMSLLFRIFSRLQTQKNHVIVTVPLFGSSEPPKLVDELARQLWTQATGRAWMWLPGSNEDTNQRLRQQGDSLARIEALLASKQPDPKELLAESQKLSEVTDALRANSQRELRKLWIVVGVGVAILVAFGINLLLKVL